MKSIFNVILTYSYQVVLLNYQENLARVIFHIFLVVLENQCRHLSNGCGQFPVGRITTVHWSSTKKNQIRVNFKHESVENVFLNWPNFDDDQAYFFKEEKGPAPKAIFYFGYTYYFIANTNTFFKEMTTYLKKELLLYYFLKNMLTHSSGWYSSKTTRSTLKYLSLILLWGPSKVWGKFSLNDITNCQPLCMVLHVYNNVFDKDYKHCLVILTIENH